MSGIPWWNTDIGGFHGGDPDDPAYREVMVRWFQFGAFSPLMRLHGFREPGTDGLGHDRRAQRGLVVRGGGRGDPRVLRLRERLKPYLQVQLTGAAEGLPVMRPLFLEFPDDERAWTVDDPFCSGRTCWSRRCSKPGATAARRLPAARRELDGRLERDDVRGRR